MPFEDQRWNQAVEGGSQLLWSLIGTLGSLIFREVWPVLLTIVAVLVIVGVGYLTHEFYAHPPEEE